VSATVLLALLTLPCQIQDSVYCQTFNQLMGHSESLFKLMSSAYNELIASDLFLSIIAALWVEYAILALTYGVKIEPTKTPTKAYTGLGILNFFFFLSLITQTPSYSSPQSAPPNVIHSNVHISLPYLKSYAPVAPQ